MINTRTSFYSLLLLAAISISSWCLFISTPVKMTIPTLADKTDTIMEDVIATIINNEGKVSLKVISPKMIHTTENDSTSFTTPHVIIYRDSAEPWHINSNFAKTTFGTSEIFFWNNVVVSHAADIKNPETTMKTDTLTIFPDKQTAATSQAVTITQPDVTVHAIGMLANLEDGTVKLMSEAKGEYVPSAS